jgi:hypothetical protein
MFGGKLLASASLTAALLLSACATPTPYQPATGRHLTNGYSEQRIEDNRYRVTFAGNEFTTRQRVENYLLFRAAEVALQAGYDGFTMVHRETDPNMRTRITSDPFGPGPWGYWGPSWRYRYGGAWRLWDPWGYDPFWANDVDVRTVTSYEASAEIVMFKGRRPDDPRSFDARQVVDYLRNAIELPR